MPRLSQEHRNMAIGKLLNVASTSAVAQHFNVHGKTIFKTADTFVSVWDYLGSPRTWPLMEEMESTCPPSTASPSLIGRKYHNSPSRYSALDKLNVTEMPSCNCRTGEITRHLKMIPKFSVVSHKQMKYALKIKSLEKTKLPGNVLLVHRTS